MPIERSIESKKRLTLVKAKVYAHEKLIARGDGTQFIKNEEKEIIDVTIQ